MNWTDETKEGFGRYFPTVQNIFDRIFDEISSFNLRACLELHSVYKELPYLIANSSRKTIHYDKLLDDHMPVVEIKGRPKLTALIRAYTDGEITIRLHIFKALAERGDQKALFALVRAILDQRYEVKKCVYDF